MSEKTITVKTKDKIFFNKRRIGRDVLMEIPESKFNENVFEKVSKKEYKAEKEAAKDSGSSDSSKETEGSKSSNSKEVI